jgi:L-serine dehydratase
MRWQKYEIGGPRMTFSIFELFNIGIGPSSSHTVGPMRACSSAFSSLSSEDFQKVDRIEVSLYGSLALTGKGHATDKAVLLGLAGFTPDQIEPDQIASVIGQIENNRELVLMGKRKIRFNPEEDIHFLKKESLPEHPNGIRITGWHQPTQLLFDRVYFSIGGGFVTSREDFLKSPTEIQCKYPFSTARELIAQCRDQKTSIDLLVLENEKTWATEGQIDEKLAQIWGVMKKCVETGMNTQGVLPGGLNVKRRAPDLWAQLLKEKDDGTKAFDWASLFALAVSEENAAGHRVVTAPTNGAAGIIPAVCHFYEKYHSPMDAKERRVFFLTAGAVGILYKLKASISGAEMGCQGEVGVASSMAAAGLMALNGGTPDQVTCAAEIAMEHHLGLTCDPVKGLVQIPCIERNTMGAIKAINAAKLAARGDGNQKVSLDKVIKTMKQTGDDMKAVYKETSLAGLAVNVTEC